MWVARYNTIIFFRVILQENKIVLRSLICSLLHFQDSDIQSVEVTNPIVPGANTSPTSKKERIMTQLKLLYISAF